MIYLSYIWAHWLGPLVFMHFIVAILITVGMRLQDTLMQLIALMTLCNCAFFSAFSVSMAYMDIQITLLDFLSEEAWNELDRNADIWGTVMFTCGGALVLATLFMLTEIVWSKIDISSEKKVTVP